MDIAGIFGVGFYLGSYASLQLGFLKGDGYAYAILNALAAGLVLLSLKEAFNLSSAVIQVSWWESRGTISSLTAPGSQLRSRH